MEAQMTLIFDLETDGLLDKVSTIHCLVTHDLKTNETYIFNDTGNQEPIVRGLQQLNDADCIIGHNIVNYDLAVIKKLYNWFDNPSLVIDTLLLSRLYHPDMMELDKRENNRGKRKNMPAQLYGRHSLESYGYRLGEYKGNFGKTTDWSDWSEEMQDYCIQDVKVTTKLWKHFLPYLSGSN